MHAAQHAHIKSGTCQFYISLFFTFSLHVLSGVMFDMVLIYNDKLRWIPSTSRTSSVIALNETLRRRYQTHETMRGDGAWWTVFWPCFFFFFFFFLVLQTFRIFKRICALSLYTETTSLKLLSDRMRQRHVFCILMSKKIRTVSFLCERSHQKSCLTCYYAVGVKAHKEITRF